MGSRVLWSLHIPPFFFFSLFHSGDIFHQVDMYALLIVLHVCDTPVHDIVFAFLLKKKDIDGANSQ